MKILNQILLSKSNRKQLVKEFQSLVWNGDINISESINKLLSELAYDLDFYEPDEKLRKETPNYFGDDRLEKEIQNILKQIEEL